MKKSNFSRLFKYSNYFDIRTNLILINSILFSLFCFFKLFLKHFFYENYIELNYQKNLTKITGLIMIDLSYFFFIIFIHNIIKYHLFRFLKILKSFSNAKTFNMIKSYQKFEGIHCSRIFKKKRFNYYKLKYIFFLFSFQSSSMEKLINDNTYN